MAKWHFFSSKLPWTSPSCSPLCGEDRRACWCSSALHWCWARERCSHIQVKATSFCQRATGRKNQALTSFEHLLLLLISLVMVALIQRSYWLVEWSNVHNNKTSSETFAKANKDERFALSLTHQIIYFVLIEPGVMWSEKSGLDTLLSADVYLLVFCWIWGIADGNMRVLALIFLSAYVFHWTPLSLSTHLFF